MKFSVPFFIFLCWGVWGTHGFCDKFPYGHMCRNMDLTGFCLQVSHFLRVRDMEARSPPYQQFEKIWTKLRDEVHADKPYVYFGGYKQYNVYSCPGEGFKQCDYPCYEDPAAASGAAPVCPNVLHCPYVAGGTPPPPPVVVPPDTCPPAKTKCAADFVSACHSTATVIDKYKPKAPGELGEKAQVVTPGPAPPGQDTIQYPPPEPAEYPGLKTGEAYPTDPSKAPAGWVGCAQECECCLIPPRDDVATGTIFSVQDGCELRYLKAPIADPIDLTLSPPPPPPAPFNKITKDTDALENPYRMNITEIEVRGTVLQNWLHIHIKSVGDVTLKGELGKGKIKMAFIMAQDADGMPLGEFVNSIPCGEECKCTDPATCHQGKTEDAFPCMFDSDRVTSNTGMMMLTAPNDGTGEGLTDIHATWRFTQSHHPDKFATEIHFQALLVDDYTHYMILVDDTTNFRLSAMSERRVHKQGVLGWNPVRDILHPTVETVGAYDYFREDVFMPEEIDCHHPLRDSHYTVEPYPDSGKKIRQVGKPAAPGTPATSEKDHCYRLDDIFQKNLPLEPMPDCDSSNPTAQRSPTKCPGLRSKIGPHMHDSYGFVRDGKVDPKQVYPWTLRGARTESYVLREGALDQRNWKVWKPADPKFSITAKLYFDLIGSGIKEENGVKWDVLQYSECETDSKDYYGRTYHSVRPGKDQSYDIQGKYGHFCTRENDGSLSGRRVLNLPLPISDWPNPLAELIKFPPVNTESYKGDRCFCPRIPPTPDPRYREPPEVQVQGRRQHAYQMIVAWNCIVPFGIFISRYYKETYSKVFFLQEYWWYTIHVLCMVSAAMFTFGGLYVMELKRVHPINFLDPNITVHVIMGYVIIAMFFFQVITGFFRLKDPKKRLFQIFTHWLLGAIEYLLAVACMVNSAFVLLSGMTCEGVIALGFVLVFQIMFYASMEVHMRNVDKMLKLTPRRSYLPPPVMRVFHKDAPDSKFRVKVLIAYFILCALSSVLQFVSMETNDLGESCFIKSKKYLGPGEDKQ